MNVLMLVSSIDSYRPGPDGFIVDWVRVLAGKVESLTVLTYHFNSSERLPRNVIVKIIRGNNFFSRNLDLFFQTYMLARSNDLIFAHILEVFGIVSGLVGKLVRKKSFFWYCQGYDLGRHIPAKAALFVVNYIFTSTSEIKDRYCKQVGMFVKDKTFIVGHGINLKHYG